MRDAKRRQSDSPERNWLKARTCLKDSNTSDNALRHEAADLPLMKFPGWEGARHRVRVNRLLVDQPREGGRAAETGGDRRSLAPRLVGRLTVSACAVAEQQDDVTFPRPRLSTCRKHHSDFAPNSF